MLLSVYGDNLWLFDDYFVSMPSLVVTLYCFHNPIQPKSTLLRFRLVYVHPIGCKILNFNIVTACVELVAEHYGNM